jgi:hypothetical protein
MGIIEEIFRTQKRKTQPKTFLEFLKVNAVEATERYYEPITWARRFLAWA